MWVYESEGGWRKGEQRGAVSCVSLRDDIHEIRGNEL